MKGRKAIESFLRGIPNPPVFDQGATCDMADKRHEGKNIERCPSYSDGSGSAS